MTAQSNLNNKYQLILEINKLKQVFRTTVTGPDRRESTAEHSWSATMIALILMEEIKNEFPQIDECKILKLTLIHDIVEIYAGDVMAFDTLARKDKEKIETQALKQLMAIAPDFGQQLHDLWYEFEERQSLEARIAKAADAICPIFQRLHAKQSYIPFNLSIANLEQVKFPSFMFSQTFTHLYQQLKKDLLAENLITLI